MNITICISGNIYGGNEKKKDRIRQNIRARHFEPANACQTYCVPTAGEKSPADE